jgi:hypothetical protein
MLNTCKTILTEKCMRYMMGQRMKIYDKQKLTLVACNVSLIQHKFLGIYLKIKINPKQ